MAFSSVCDLSASLISNFALEEFCLARSVRNVAGVATTICTRASKFQTQNRSIAGRSLPPPRSGRKNFPSVTMTKDSDQVLWRVQSSCEHDPTASSRRPCPNGSKWLMTSFSAFSVVGAALILLVCVVEYQKSSESVTLIENRRIMTTMLSDGDGINGDINRQAKKLIQRAAQEKAHAAQENKKGADLVTKAERTCKIAEVSI
jgi:hypothetical protein